MPRQRPIATCDCETDPFKHLRVPMPFLWGYYDGKRYIHFDHTEPFVNFIKTKRVIMYAHNGGKFDFMYFIPYLENKQTKVQLINSRIVSMLLGECELRDSFSCVPQSMKSIQKMDMDISKMESAVRHLHMPEILERNRTDCVYLYNLMNAFRRDAGGAKTIASNAFSFCKKKMKIDPGKTNHRFDKNFRDFYFGGRTECFQPGVHINLSILDIKSAYPYAMMHDHATGDSTDFYRASSIPKDMTREQLQRAFIVLTCNAKGCFPWTARKRDENGNIVRFYRGPEGLQFPHEYNQFYVTGWEYVAARELNLISDIIIQRVSWSDKTINFTPYVMHWFEYKERHGKKDDKGELLSPIEYTIGKIMLNSLYGKLAQNPMRYSDYKIVPAGTKICREKPLTKFCKVCDDATMDHGWNWALEFGKHEIHERPSLWRYQHLEKMTGVQWEGKKIYKNVATGASITGFTRAYLLRAMHTIGIENVIYTDTDSLICKSSADLSRLKLGKELGDWDIEDQNSPIGHFAGKKLYAIQTSKPGKQKVAHKGARLTFDEIARVANGETLLWKNDAPSFSILTGKTPFMKNALGEIDTAKLFVKREIRHTAKSLAKATTN
jgi:hypothetical protein